MKLALRQRMMKMNAAMILLALLGCTASAFAADDARADGPPRIVITTPDEKRPRALPALYVGLAGLQAYDGYSTLRGVRRGARETNPIVAGLAAQPVAFWSMKAVSTTTSIYFAEQLWRQKHRAQAVVLMVATNGMMAAVAARNASILSRR